MFSIGRRKLAPGAAVILVLLLLTAACADEARAPEGEDPAASVGARERYAEGEIAIAAEMLDIGLLKGTASAEAVRGWLVVAISVNATAPNGVNWGVIEFPRGIGSSSASEFFEVQMGELSRGDQLALTVTATFESDSGERVDRQAIDRWPP